MGGARNGVRRFVSWVTGVVPFAAARRLLLAGILSARICAIRAGVQLSKRSLAVAFIIVSLANALHFGNALGLPCC